MPHGMAASSEGVNDQDEELKAGFGELNGTMHTNTTRTILFPFPTQWFALEWQEGGDEVRRGRGRGIE